MHTQKTLCLMRSIHVQPYTPPSHFLNTFPTHDPQKALRASSNTELPKEPSPILEHSAPSAQAVMRENSRPICAFISIKFPFRPPANTELPNDPSPIPEHFALRSLNPGALNRKPQRLRVSASKTPLPVRNRTGHRLAFNRVTLS